MRYYIRYYLQKSIKFLKEKPLSYNYLLLKFTNFKVELKKTYNIVYTMFLDDGWIYIKGLFTVAFIDALIVDDEPLFEPVEWSLWQSWILFVFLFAWIGENLISSRYGSYTGRDKRVWFSWFKTFWLIEGWYLISMTMAALWVMVPHYYELTYNVTYLFNWWTWYNRVFFCKFTLLFTIVLFLGHILLINNRWLNWRSSLVLILLVNLFLGYLLYSSFIITFFGYFTDPRWHSKTRVIDYIQLSHEPGKWSWGDAKRDHFTHHRSKTVFWLKNDGPFASAFLFFNALFFINLFSLTFYWLTLARRVYATKEVSYTYLTYCISSLKQFWYFTLGLFLLIVISYCFIFWRSPLEFTSFITTSSFFFTLFDVILDLPSLFRDIFNI